MNSALQMSLIQEDPLKHFVKAGNNGPSIRRTLIDPDTGFPLDLTGAAALFVVTNYTKTPAFSGDAIIEDAENGVVRYDFSADDTAEAGTFWAEFQITFAEGQIMTYPAGNSESLRNYIRLYIVDGLAVEEA
jgi:BppU N-terminal domain